MYAGLAPTSSATIVRALDRSEQPSAVIEPSSPSLHSTSSSDDASSFLPSEEEEGELEEFLLDAFQGFDAAKISAV
jgi:hypothetical protein